jgi:hypothetical protein
MSDSFEGLSLPELMDLLHGIVEPVPVSRVPETAGWWVVSGWLLALLAIGCWHWLAHRRRNRYRRRALAELTVLEARSTTEPVLTAAGIAALLKRTALAAYPRAQVASLYGADWAEFLCESSNNDRVVTSAVKEFADAAYRTDADGRTPIAPARRWIRGHRA